MAWGIFCPTTLLMSLLDWSSWFTDPDEAVLHTHIKPIKCACLEGYFWFLPFLTQRVGIGEVKWSQNELGKQVGEGVAAFLIHSVITVPVLAPLSKSGQEELREVVGGNWEVAQSSNMGRGCADIFSVNPPQPHQSWMSDYNCHSSWMLLPFSHFFPMPCI